VQPCDEDERNMIFFFFIFPSNGVRWNEADRGQPKYSGGGGKPVPMPLCPPQIPHGPPGPPRWEAGDYPPEPWHGL
jgi:hypothetical protein